MKKKKGTEMFLEVLGNKLFIGGFIFIILSLATVMAGNVILKGGSMTVEDNFNVSNILFANTVTENIGIGTTNPFQKFHVNGNVLVNGTINSTVDICIQGGICLKDSNGFSGETKWSANYSNVAFENQANVFGAFNQSFDDGTLFIDATTNRVTIGKRDTSSQYNFLVYSSNDGVRQGIVSAWKNKTATIDFSTSETGGFFGNKLQIGYYGSQSTGWGGVPPNSAVFDAMAPNGAYIISEAVSANSSIIFMTNGWEAINKRMIITSDGKVGIGTMAPQNKLNVVGDINVTGSAYFGGGSSGKVVCWKTANKIGYCSTAVGADGSCTCN